MSLNYLVSDSFARIQNGLKANLFSVEILNSTYIENILKILYEEGYILGYSFSKKNVLLQKTITVLLKYDLFGKPLITKITAISTPGLRRYVTVKDLISLRKQNITLNKMYLISTSKGIVSDINAIKNNLGGELICKIN